jgi:class 3 adenylate cyclase
VTLQGRYLLRMLAPAALQFVLNAIFFVTSGLLAVDNWWPALLGLVVLLVGLNIAVSRRLFAPIEDHLAGRGPVEPALARLRDLPNVSAIWWAILTALNTVPTIGYGYLYIMPFEAMGVPWSMVGWHLAWLTVLLSVALGVLAYFLIEHFAMDLRAELHASRGLALAPGRGRLSWRIGVPLALLVLVPLLLIYLDVTAFAALREAQGYDLAGAVIADVIGALIGALVLAYFVVENLRRPIRVLGAAQRRVAKGDLSLRVPVAVDHEIGQLAAGFNDMVAGLAERETIREALGKYVSEGVAAKLLADRGRLKGEIGVATVLFTDISGFTGVSESMAPERVIELLNAYLAIAMQPIAEQGGVVLNLMGDAIFAAFNMPAGDPDHATKAIRAALAIQERLGAGSLPGGLRLSTRIGINTGPVVAGAVGDATRLSYTLLGDTVNTASRIEKLCKEVGAPILVADRTRQAAPGFAYQSAGTLAVPGRQEKVIVHRVLGPKT